MQARFWINRGADNAVRVKLEPGQALSWESRGATDEGWSAEGATYRHEGDRVVCESWGDGRDCDGRSSWGAECECRLDMLDAHTYEWDGQIHTAPKWERIDSRQRDYTAEAMGY